MSQQSVVRVGSVTKTFPRGDVTALQDIDLELAPREFVSLIGPSGCGKSTLLRVIGDLIDARFRHDQRQERKAGAERR